MARIKDNTFNLGDGLTLEIIPAEGDCYPYGAVRIIQPHNGDIIIAPSRHESAVDTAIALRVAARFFDRRAKVGSAGVA